METAYIVVKTLATRGDLMYFAGTTFAGSAPRWSSDYTDAVQFQTVQRAERVMRAWGGTIHEVDA